MSILRIVINNGKKFVTKVFWKLKSQIENEININQSFYKMLEDKYSYYFYISSQGLRKVATFSKDAIRSDAILFTFLAKVARGLKETHLLPNY